MKRGKMSQEANRCGWRFKNQQMFWQPGEPLGEQDIELLQTVKEFYLKHGYSPSKAEISNHEALKQRFRLWKDVLTATGLPPLTDLEQISRRTAAAGKNSR